MQPPIGNMPTQSRAGRVPSGTVSSAAQFLNSGGTITTEQIVAANQLQRQEANRTALGTAGDVAFGSAMGLWMFEFFGGLTGNFFGGLLSYIPWIGPKLDKALTAVTVAPLTALKSTAVSDLASLPGNYAGLVSNDAAATRAALKNYAGFAPVAGSAAKITPEMAMLHGAASSFGGVSVDLASAKVADTGIGKLIASRVNAHEVQLAKNLRSSIQDMAAPRTGMFAWLLGSRYKGAMPAELQPVHTEAASLLQKLEAGAMPSAVEWGGLTQKMHTAAAEVGAKGFADHATALSGNAEKLTSGIASWSGLKAAAVEATSVGALASHAAHKAGNASIFNATVKTGLAAGTVVQTSRSVDHMRESIDTLKQLYADYTGKRVSDIGTFQILLGNLPPVLQQARSDMFRHFGPETLAAVGNIGANLVLMKNTLRSSIAPLMGFQMVQMMAPALSPGNEMLDIYRTILDIRGTGQPVPPQLYAGLISIASEKASNVGENDPLVRAMAAEYVKEGVPPVQVLKEIEQGKPFDDRAKRIGKQLTEASKELQEQVKREIEASKARASASKGEAADVAVKADKHADRKEVHADATHHAVAEVEHRKPRKEVHAVAAEHAGKVQAQHLEKASV